MKEAGLRRMLLAVLLVAVGIAGLSGCSDEPKATANLNVERAERAGI